MDSERLQSVQQALLEWFSNNGSTDLPWRQTRDPYAVLVSEVMLQQTQRERVIPKFLAFMQRFPTFATLAGASTADVIRAWSGLGYNSRALRLQMVARAATAGGGRLPADVAGLRALPGIGDYTAGAIACYSFGQQVAFVDTNIRRVLGRIFDGEARPIPNPKRDRRIAEEARPEGHAWEWNSALMDLGARICLARAPRCAVCPVAGYCEAEPAFREASSPATLRLVAEPRASYQAEQRGKAAKPALAGSDRYLRGRIVEALRRLPDGEEIELAQLAAVATGMALPPDDTRMQLLADRLARDGLVQVRTDDSERRWYSLPQ
ncbi:MAG: HhH-GPD family protein [Dehalococcoidia bacterium]